MTRIGFYYIICETIVFVIIPICHTLTFHYHVIAITREGGVIEGKEIRGGILEEFYILCNKTRHSYIYIYMLRVAGQTARLIGMNFFVDTHGWPGGVIG